MSCAYGYGFFLSSGLCVQIHIIGSFNVLVIQSWGFIDSLNVLMIRYWGFLYSFDICANTRDDWTAWRICLEYPIFRVLCPTICKLWLDRLDDPIFWVPLRSLSEVVHEIHRLILPDRFLIRRSSHDSPSNSYLRLFLVDLVEKYITGCSNNNVHYACSVVVIMYVPRVLRVRLVVIIIS